MSAYQFQLLPALATNEYESLKADIAANGVMVPVEFDQNGQILDGHHRVRAWTELVESGLELPEYPSLVRRFDDQDSRIEHALKLNLQRRHLTREQLRDVAGDLWERGWSKSRIGSTLSVDEGTIRYWLRGSEISEPETVVGRDGKSYPSSRPKQTAVATNAKERRQAQRLLSVDESGDDDSQKGSDYIVDIGPFWRKVDVKAREPGCSRFWSKDDTGEPLPELAIELVSVHGARTGWALDWAKHTDYLMFTFDPTDWPYCYVVPALAIRQMTERFESYMRRNFQVSMQTSGLWTSECVFVPINKIAEGIVASWKFRYAEEQAS